jgi:hypothetical protein
MVFKTTNKKWKEVNAQDPAARINYLLGLDSTALETIHLIFPNGGHLGIRRK